MKHERRISPEFGEHECQIAGCSQVQRFGCIHNGERYWRRDYCVQHTKAYAKKHGLTIPEHPYLDSDLNELPEEE